jgi:hypothetical protein
LGVLQKTKKTTKQLSHTKIDERSNSETVLIARGVSMRRSSDRDMSSNNMGVESSMSITTRCGQARIGSSMQTSINESACGFSQVIESKVGGRDSSHSNINSRVTNINHKSGQLGHIEALQTEPQKVVIIRDCVSRDVSRNNEILSLISEGQFDVGLDADNVGSLGKSLDSIRSESYNKVDKLVDFVVALAVGPFIEARGNSSFIIGSGVLKVFGKKGVCAGFHPFLVLLPH